MELSAQMGPAKGQRALEKRPTSWKKACALQALFEGPPNPKFLGEGHREKVSRDPSLQRPQPIRWKVPSHVRTPLSQSSPPSRTVPIWDLPTYICNRMPYAEASYRLGLVSRKRRFCMSRGRTRYVIVYTELN